MPPELLSRDLVHTLDAIDLPAPGTPVEGRARREDSYPILVTRTFEQTVERLLELVGDAQVAVITDETVAELYGQVVIRALERAGLEPELATVPAGERHKTLGQAHRLLDWLTGTQVGRRDLIVTLGGGVVIDMGGFVASAYMRGVPYVNVPTTLIGQVDAGIGGKLAVNHPVAKNLIGGFFQPRAVISDVSFLRTIGRRQLRAGLAEAIKKAIIASPAYWDLIEARAEAILAGDPEALEELVHGASAIKAELIERDPYEQDSRRTLGFGHAIAHPLETVTSYSELLHGEAVAFGMAVEAPARRGPRPAAGGAPRAHARTAAARGAAHDGGRAARDRGRRPTARRHRADQAHPWRRLSLRAADRPRRDADRGRRDARGAEGGAQPLRHPAAAMSAIAHVGLTVPDLDGAVAWYSDVLGLEALGEVMTVRAGDGHAGRVAADVLGADFGRFRQAHLAGANGVAIELFEFEAGNRPPGLFHLCVVVPDVARAAERIATSGGRQSSEVWEIFSGEPYLTCYCEDPFGTTVELYSHSHERTYANR